MSADLRGIRLAVIGGDDRELYLIPELLKLGAYIIGIGFEKAPTIPGMSLASSIVEVANSVDALLFPMFGIDDRGFVKAKYSAFPIVVNNDVLRAIPKHVPIFIGWARPALKAASNMLELEIIETANLDELAILNSIPSAEGAIQMAMEATLITIHGSKSFVLGLGRCGWTIARMLYGLGAEVTGVARKPADLARAREMGFCPVDFAELDQVIGQAEIVFNTVPQLVLDKSRLEKMSGEAVIIDLASIPGGTDFEYAQMMGIKAVLAPGLPGIVAPKTAGKILAHVYPPLILRHRTTGTV